MLAGKAPLPFQLGEMSGKFQTKEEHTVSIILHIMYKMKVTRHLTWTICNKDMVCLWEILSYIRNGIWCFYIMSNCSQIHEVKIRDVLIPTIIDKLQDLASMITSKLTLAEGDSLCAFQSWKIILMLIDFLLAAALIEPWRTVAETNGLPEMSPDIQSILLTSDEFNNKWQQLLDSLSGSLVPYNTLFEQICGGSLNQCCVVCKRKFTVKKIIHKPENQKDSGLFFTAVNAFFCGDTKCNFEIGQRRTKLMKIYSEIQALYQGFTCDSCHLPSAKIHRCTRCLTKQYCGVKCRDKDWAKVHSHTCRKNKVVRKRKG